jgi:hypothetical protein
MQFSHTTISNNQAAQLNAPQCQLLQQQNQNRQTGPHLMNVTAEDEKVIV